MELTEYIKDLLYCNTENLRTNKNVSCSKANLVSTQNILNKENFH